MLDETHKGFTIQRFGAFDLKWVLVRRIVLAAMLCVAVGAGIVLSNVATDAKRQNLDVSGTITKYLKLQLVRIDSALDLPQRFPDWTAVVDFTLQQGQCAKFTTVAGKVYSRCVGTDHRTATAPAWFSGLYEPLFLGTIDALSNLVHRNENKGTLEVTINPAVVSHQAWLSVSDMLRLSLALILIMCGLVYVVVDRALKPTAEILSGFLRLAGGDLTAQLPRYRLRELDRISESFNLLAKELRVTTTERSEFARKLIDAQEQERRHIARELHDDVAQQLTALSGLASSIKSSVDGDRKELVSEAEELVRVSGRAMRSLRETLTYLRPQEIDELGLLTSLNGMIAEHNHRSRSGTHFSLATSGQVEGFDAQTSAHIYRIIQEGLNNAARHADAKAVVVSLKNKGSAATREGSARDVIELGIEDDGTGWIDTPSSDTLGTGFGLLGMRERVSALDGKLAVGTSPPGGVSLRVEFSVPCIRETA